MVRFPFISSITRHHVQRAAVVIVLAMLMFVTHRLAYTIGRDSERDSFQYVSGVQAATDNQSRLALLRNCFRALSRLAGSARDEDVQKLLRIARQAIEDEETKGPDLIHRMYENERKVRKIDAGEEEKALAYSIKLVKDVRELTSKIR
jgi:hypothetical protein